MLYRTESPDMGRIELDRRPVDLVQPFFSKITRIALNRAVWHGSEPCRPKWFGMARFGMVRHLNELYGHITWGWGVWWDLGCHFVAARILSLIEIRELSQNSREALLGF